MYFVNAITYNIEIFLLGALQTCDLISRPAAAVQVKRLTAKEHDLDCAICRGNLKLEVTASSGSFYLFILLLIIE